MMLIISSWTTQSMMRLKLVSIISNRCQVHLQFKREVTGVRHTYNFLTFELIINKT